MYIRIGSKTLAFILCFLFVWVALTGAEKVLIPNIVNISRDSTDAIIIVDKSRQMLYVVKSYLSNPIVPADTFRVTTGKVNGNKEKEGDNRTPEGIYKIVGDIPGSQLPPRYGPLAYVLDYPNFVDRLMGRTGSNIWIHGRNEEITDFQTKGCISLHNHSILKLRPYIKVNRTRVIIQDTIKNVTQRDYEIAKLRWKTYLANWKKSWEIGDTSTYFQFYSEKFTTKTYPSLRSFKESKKALERRYPWKSIDISQILVLETKYESEISFQQEYICPEFYSIGFKTLRLIPEKGLFLIVNEDFTRTKTRTYIKDAIKNFLREWISSWESRNISKYISFYDSTFSSRGMNLEKWYSYKKELFDKSGKIDIEIEKIQIKSTKKLVWEVSFLQKYSSSIYKDYGRKILQLKNKPGHFKIVSEKWERIR